MIKIFHMVKSMRNRSIPFWSLLLAIACQSEALTLDNFEKNLRIFTLENGLTFLVYERPQAPVVSFITYVNVGSVNEVKGITGLAHIFEHMAFKGSSRIGTRNPKAELKILEQIDDAFNLIKIEKMKGRSTDSTKIKSLERNFLELQAKADSYIIQDEFEEAFIREGAVGLNASTSRDATWYIVSLPSNKVELWMSLESERFNQPVMREFYKEVSVVKEERRMRTENRPVGKLMEDFFALAYKAHPYGEPVIGHMSDLESITRSEAESFFKKFYCPANMVIAVVGDVVPSDIEKWARVYFGRLANRPLPEGVETVEPPQLGEKRISLEDPSQPFVMIGYHKPATTDSDNAVFDAISDVMGEGRTSRLYKKLVKEKKVAVEASGFTGMPGNQYPNLFLFYAIPAKSIPPGTCESLIYDEIENLKIKAVSRDDLQKAKTRAKAELIYGLTSNEGIGRALAYYQTTTKDWRNLFKRLEQIEKVTAQDLQRVAKKYFTKRNRIVGVIETAPLSH